MDAYISLREKYEIIKPAFFNKDVSLNWGKGKARRGFDVVRYTIANDVIKDICNISFDTSDKNSISIQSISNKLKNPDILNHARSCSIQDKGEFHQRQLGSSWELFSETWESYQCKSWNTAIKNIRDKLVAHLELQRDKNTNAYTRLNLEEEGLKWSDLEEAIQMIEKMVVSLHLIITGKGFSVDSLETLEDDAKAFWKVN